MCDTGWRRLIGSPKLQIIFHRRATKDRSLLQKMTYEDKGFYESLPTFMTYSPVTQVDLLPPLKEIASGAFHACVLRYVCVSFVCVYTHTHALCTHARTPAYIADEEVPWNHAQHDPFVSVTWLMHCVWTIHVTPLTTNGGVVMSCSVLTYIYACIYILFIWMRHVPYSLAPYQHIWLVSHS